MVTIKRKAATARLIGLLGVFVLLPRWLLIEQGGQFFFPDEMRYDASRTAAGALIAGDLGAAFHAVFRADHLLFKIIGVLPALLEKLLGESSRIPAVFFGLFSVVSFGLLYAIVVRVGEACEAALFSVALLCLSSTFLLYVRHLVPYDMAMALGLLALFVGLRRPARLRDSILCGLCASATFLAYSGYWLLGGLALVVHVMWPPLAVAACLRRAVSGGLALILPIAMLLLFDHFRQGSFLRDYFAFAGAVNQGSFSEGAALPWKYFWHGEHFLLGLFLVALLFGVYSLIDKRGGGAAGLGSGAVVFIYGGLTLFSVGLEKFVVYGRTSRQLLPFLCILSGLLLERLWSSSRRGRIVAGSILGLAALQAVINFAPLFSLIYPDKFFKQADQVQAGQPGEYEVLNAYCLYPGPDEPLPNQEVVLRQPHPLQYLPYQYEGYTIEQRQKLRSADLSMLLLKKPPPADSVEKRASKQPEIFSDGFESGKLSAWLEVDSLD